MKTDFGVNLKTNNCSFGYNPVGMRSSYTCAITGWILNEVQPATVGYIIAVWCT